MLLLTVIIRFKGLVLQSSFCRASEQVCLLFVWNLLASLHNKMNNEYIHNLISVVQLWIRFSTLTSISKIARFLIKYIKREVIIPRQVVTLTIREMSNKWHAWFFSIDLTASVWLNMKSMRDANIFEHNEVSLCVYMFTPDGFTWMEVVWIVWPPFWIFVWIDSGRRFNSLLT